MSVVLFKQKVASWPPLLTDSTAMPQPKKLLDQVSDAIRTRHYSIRTEDAYVSWIKRFILYHGKKHPRSSKP